MSLNKVDGQRPKFGDPNHIKYLKMNQKPAHLNLKLPKWLKENLQTAAKGLQKPGGVHDMVVDLLIEKYGNKEDLNQTSIE